MPDNLYPDFDGRAAEYAQKSADSVWKRIPPPPNPNGLPRNPAPNRVPPSAYPPPRSPRDSNRAASPVYAGLAVRLFAWLIDMAIMSVPLMILGVTRFSLSAFDPLSPLSRAILFRFSLLDIVAWAIPVIYFTALTYSYGATLGKMLLKLEVVPADGGRLTLWAVLVREVFARYLSSFAWIGYWMMIPDDEKRALHDRLSDTRVVYSHTLRTAQNPRPAPPSQPVPRPQAVADTPPQPVADTPAQSERVNLDKSSDTGVSLDKSADIAESPDKPADTETASDKSADTGASPEKPADTGDTQA